MSAVIYFLYSIALLGLSALVFVAAAQSSSAVHLFADHVLVSASRQQLFVGDGSLSTGTYLRIDYRTYTAFLLLLVGANVFSVAALRRVRR